MVLVLVIEMVTVIELAMGIGMGMGMGMVVNLNIKLISFKPAREVLNDVLAHGSPALKISHRMNFSQ